MSKRLADQLEGPRPKRGRCEETTCYLWAAATEDVRSCIWTFLSYLSRLALSRTCKVFHLECKKRLELDWMLLQLPSHPPLVEVRRWHQDRFNRFVDALSECLQFAHKQGFPRFPVVWAIHGGVFLRIVARVYVFGQEVSILDAGPFQDGVFPPCYFYRIVDPATLYGERSRWKQWPISYLPHFKRVLAFRCYPVVLSE